MLANWSKTEGARLGPIPLASGVSVWNAITLQIAAMVLAILMPFINFAQPYILTEHLGIPQAEQGTVSGNLGFYTEIVIILMSGFVGAMSDRLGRRIIFAGGMLVCGISFILYPLAGSFGELVLYRLIFAAGAAMTGAMLVAVLSDYPSESARGKMAGLVGVMSIVGVLILIATMANLPLRFRDAGYGALEAGRYSYWIAAAVGIVAALILSIGLKKPSGKRVTEKSGPLDTLKQGLHAAAQNRRLTFAFASAFCGRADLIVVTTFLSLWVVVFGADQGISAQESIARAGLLFGIINIAALFSAPIFGWLIDKIGRLKAQCLALFIAAIGYTAMGFMSDPLSTTSYFAAIILGMGQMAAITASQALVGQEAPADIRGSISGCFTFCGALGILFATKVGGTLFDVWMPGAPFVLMGVANLLVLLFGIWVYSKSPDTESIQPA